MSLSCIECSCRIDADDAVYNGATARALIPFAGRLMSDGPFCSERCKRDYVSAAENKASAKAAKKSGVSNYSSKGSTDLVEQRRILELQKEERDELRQQKLREEEEESARQRKAKAAQHREQGLPTLAFLVGNSPILWCAATLYIFATFFCSITLSETKGKSATWVWVVSGLLFMLIASLVGRKMYQEKIASKVNG